MTPGLAEGLFWNLSCMVLQSGRQEEKLFSFAWHFSLKSVKIKFAPWLTSWKIQQHSLKLATHPVMNAVAKFYAEIEADYVMFK